MRRTRAFFAAPAALDLAPTSAKAALLHRRVQRLLGGPFTASGDVASRTAHVFTDIIESGKKNSSLPNGKELALAGRAAALVACNCFDAAAEDVAAIASAARQNAGLQRIASTLAVQIDQAKLSYYIRTLSVQGSEASMNPKVVDDLHKRILQHLEELRSASRPDDFAPHLLQAEALLRRNDGSESAKIAETFNKIKESMFNPPAIVSPESKTAKKEEEAALARRCQSAINAFEAQRAWATDVALTAAGKSKSASVVSGNGSQAKLLRSLTLEENAALLQVAAWQDDEFAAIKVLDMGDAEIAGYSPAVSCKYLLVSVGHFLGLRAAHDSVVPHLDEELATITERGTHDVSAIQAALNSNDNSSHILDQIGDTTATRLSVADDGFTSIMESLDNGYTTGTDFANLSTDRAIARLESLEQSLLNQAYARCQVGLAAALTAAGNIDKADQLLDDVIEQGKYAEMWRAYLLKGGVAKQLGHVEQSDAAFRALHALKRQPEGRDLPLRDKHRDVSVF